MAGVPELRHKAPNQVLYELIVVTLLRQLSDQFIVFSIHITNRVEDVPSEMYLRVLMH